jgi:hypothetical protein
MARSRVKESREDIFREIEAKVRRDGEVKADSKRFADEVRDYWRSISPVRTGKYAASIHVERQRDHRGFPTYWVITRDWKAHFIEFGTHESEDHGATPEFAPAARTALRYGGTPGD